MRGLAVIAALALAAGCGDRVTANWVPVTNVCGDGVAEGWEECDCGNDPQNLPRDCTAVNSDEPNQLCRTDCLPQRCGDGIIDDQFHEECDDGPDNSSTSGHCRPDCTLAKCGDGVLDPGEGCDNGPDNSDAPDNGLCRTDCTPLRCGDGIKDLAHDEECDDGNTDEGDGCVNCKNAFCGDGYIRLLVEQCDDGADNSNEPDAHCRLDCTLRRCGDGVKDSDEECDDGPNNSDTLPDACRLSCRNPSCGDGIVDTGEECDTGSARSDTTPDACRLDCKNPSCGDGVIDTGEGCDCGTDPAHLPSGCTKENCTGAGCTCSPTCRSSLCGNGTIDSGEECDDGDGVNCDTPNCHCRTTCKLRYCGDGIVDDLASEECDTGAARSDTLPDHCRLSCKNPSCGDGVIDTGHGEQCDDFSYWGLSCNQSNCQKQYGPAVVLNTLSINSNPSVGCDLNGDGSVDNWLGPIGPTVNGQLQTALTNGTLLFMFELQRLNDATGQDDADVDLATFQGVDSDYPAYPDDNFSGQESLYVDPISVDANGNTLVLFSHSALVGGDFAGTTDTFLLPFSTGTLMLKRVQLTAHFAQDVASISGVSIPTPAQLCGVVPACSLDMMANPVPTMIPADTLLEVLIVAGQMNTPAFDYWPDIDMDTDGLERYTITMSGGKFVLATCVDGDGTVVQASDSASPTGRCPCDPRFADGYSITTNFTAVGTQLVGICSGSLPPCI